MSDMYYQLFLRNWLNCKADEAKIDLAVTKGLLTEAEATAIKNTPRDCDI